MKAIAAKKPTMSRLSAAAHLRTRLRSAGDFADFRLTAVPITLPRMPSAAPANAGRARADLALVDITLRDGATGLAAARALHEDRVETVLVSGDTNLRAKAESVHALGYIAKPADANAVARAVSNIERHHAWASRQSRVPEEDV